MFGTTAVDEGTGFSLPATAGISIRRRVDLIIAAVLFLAILVLTAASAVMSRKEVLRSEQLHARALLEHLAGMHLRSESEMRAEIANLSSYLASVQGTVSVAGEDDRADPGSAIERPVMFDGERRILRYIVSEARVAQLTRTIVIMHFVAGMTALILILAAVEWTLRCRLIAPLKLFRNQLEALCSDGGSLVLPPVDEELAALRASVGRVGPEVAARTLEWFRDQQRRESAAAQRRIRRIVEVRVPLVIERIERLTQSSRLSVLSLSEAYCAEEEMLAICAALAELQAVIDSPEPEREGNA